MRRSAATRSCGGGPPKGRQRSRCTSADTGSTATTYTDTAVTAGTPHVYRVRAINVAGVGPWSNFARADLE